MADDAGDDVPAGTHIHLAVAVEGGRMVNTRTDEEVFVVRLSGPGCNHEFVMGGDADVVLRTGQAIVQIASDRIRLERSTSNANQHPKQPADC